MKQDVRRLLALAGPVVVTQLGSMMLGVVDTLMLGRLGIHELDAGALGNVWLFGTMIFGMGLMFGMDPIVSQAHGRGDASRTGTVLQQAIFIALAASIPLGALWLLTERAMLLMGQDASLASDAHNYVRVQVPSLPLFLAFHALRQYLQGRGIVAPALWVTLAANAFNVFGNWVLIFGHLGFPAMGLEGAGIATMATRSFLLVGLVAWTWARGLYVGAWRPWGRHVFDRRELLELLSFGFPVGLQYLLEVWAFQICTIMAGWLGKHELAAHSIVLNMASVAFMLPLGISIGAATRVGNLVGARDPVGARRTAWVALVMGASVMALSATAFVVLRHVLPGLYTDDPEVLALAAAIMPIAAAFQLFDGTQVVGGGVLRGFGETRPAAVFNFVGYYLLALPVGGWLAFRTDLGLNGIWWALALGLAIVALSLLAWIRWFSPRARAEIAPDLGPDSSL